MEQICGAQHICSYVEFRNMQSCEKVSRKYQHIRLPLLSIFLNPDVASPLTCLERRSFPAPDKLMEQVAIIWPRRCRFIPGIQACMRCRALRKLTSISRSYVEFRNMQSCEKVSRKYQHIRLPLLSIFLNPDVASPLTCLERRSFPA